MCAKPARTGNLLEVVLAYAAGAMEPENERIFLALLIALRDEQAIGHGRALILVNSRNESVHVVLSHRRVGC